MNLCIRKKRKMGMPNKIRLDNNAKADFNRPCCHDNTYCERDRFKVCVNSKN